MYIGFRKLNELLIHFKNLFLFIVLLDWVHMVNYGWKTQNIYID